MAIAEIDDLTSEAPPAKRVRRESDLELAAQTKNMDSHLKTLAQSGIPGLGMLEHASKSSDQSPDHPVQAKAMFPEPIPATVQQPEQAPLDLLGHLEAAIADPLTSRKDSVMEEAPMQPSQASADLKALGTKNGPAIPNDNNDKMEVEKPDAGTATDEPIEGIRNSEILDGEQASRTGGPSEPNLPIPVEGEPVEDDHPEWEIDSSPIESSSDDSSSDDSSSEDSDEEGENYKLLSPEEQARILMAGDGGSDDEGGSKAAKGAGGQLRTKNEIPEEVIPKPDVTITLQMNIEELGTVEGIVENTVLIKAKTSGEYRVLESGSVLCLEDRKVIGAVAETIGRVQQPFYSVRFTNAADVQDAGMTMGTKIFYSEQHSTYVFTQALKAYKGSDASNLHDEEVGDEEIEFSDDEAEAEHKRKLKQKKMEKRGGKIQPNGNAGCDGHGHPLRQEYDATVGINYDDDEDGPYKPLARPAGFADTVGRGEAPEEAPYSGRPERPSRGGDQSRSRGRGDRGRGRGRANDRGRGRGGSNFSQPRNDSHSHPSPGSFSRTLQVRQGNNTQPAVPPAFPQMPGFPMPFPIPPPFYSPNPQTPQQAGPQWSQVPPPPPFPYQQMPQFPQPYMQPGWSNNGAGAFINPAFFSGAQGPNMQNQWNQNQQGGNRNGNANGGK